MISFKKYKNGLLSLTDVVDQLKTTIVKEDFFRLSDTELAYKALGQFNFKKLEATQESISQYAQRVIDVTGFLKNSDNPTSSFLRIYLNLGSKLLQVKNQLEAEAKKHLKQINDLLNYYGTLPFIIKYKTEPTAPRNNEERKQLEFYKRTLVKKEQIIAYLLDGILDRALEKSATVVRSEWGENLKDIMAEIEKSEDFPYLDFIYGLEYKHALDMERLDFRQINPLKNKFQWIDKALLEASSYTSEIDEGFERHILPVIFFSEMIVKLKDIPIVKDRLSIFEEMDDLFTAQKWYALYALALPQVEGIFTEMQEMTPKKRVKNSLTEKVNNLRSVYEMAQYTFDYYEFTLADLRNSFSHTGKIDQPKKKCYHLLADIWYLLEICTELDTPLSKLAKLIKEGNTSFKHIGNFSGFINLLMEIDKNSQLALIKSQADEFIYKDIVKNINLRKLIDSLEKDFEKSVANFNTNMATLMQVMGEKPLVLFAAPIKDIRPRISAIESAFNKLPILVNEDLKLLLDSNNFLHHFVKIFPKIHKSVRDRIELFRSKHKDTLKIINFLNEQVKLEVPDDFLLFTRKLEHYIK
jgi:hypothetical protein